MTQAYGGELGDQRQQNMATESANKNIINRFNELNTGARNTAAAQNLAARQQLGAGNTQMRNQAQAYNLEGKAKSARQQYQDRLDKLQLIGGAMGNKAQSYLAESEANAAARKGLGTAIGTGIGAIAGGPAGAKIGGSIGGGLG